MKLPVYLYGHPVLRKNAEPLEKDFPNLKELVNNMFETMYASEGVGLAAPQIGQSIALIVIDADPVAETFPECKGRKFALINPELEVLDGEKISRPEGCLSVPGISEDVKRVEHIRLTWFDEDFQEHQEEMTGFLARIVQHEMDHLFGELYIDHISPLRKQFIRGKLHNIMEGKTRCDYPVKYAPRKRK
jgi:peptide deformylase